MPAIPEILKNPALLQLVFAKLEAETQRAETATWALAEAENSRDEWKAIADKERERAAELEAANAARREEAAELRIANNYLRQSVDEYRKELDDTRVDLQRARSAKKWWGIAGVGAGLAIGYVSRQ